MSLVVVRFTVILIFGICSCLEAADGENEDYKFPMLFFDYEEIDELRMKADSTHKEIALQVKISGEELKEHKYLMPPESYEVFSSKWNELYGNRLNGHAFYCLLYPNDEKAFELVTLSMDRFVSYRDWYVDASRGRDDVPVGHNLAGFAIALDFLYHRFDSHRRLVYLDKINEITSTLYARFRKPSGWAKQHIHNHAPTNIVAILLGAMLLERDGRYPEATRWRKGAIEALEKGLDILSYVIDGSSDEGVAYGSYSSRGWTEYAFLARRHFNVDHSSHPWFRAHFWYFYATVLPGFQRTVGVADSNHNWFHGPESQLVFLDSFVMKNGYGNWLADRVRAHRTTQPPYAASTAQRFSCIHTEFIFFNSSIKPRRPELPSGNDLYVLSDWGVATVGTRGSELVGGSTFLSMKSGSLNGETVADVMQGGLAIPYVKGWTNFNGGHEHQDQNSFVFAPNGRYFITEALYSDKKAYLDNPPLFYPNPESECLPYWQGQTGGCRRWLEYKKIPVPRGRLVTTSVSGGMAHFAGEAVDAYPSFLMLKSVQRSIVLLRSDLLLVLDSIHLHEGSRMRKTSVNFHNILHQFHEHRDLGLKGASIQHPDGNYSFLVLQEDGGTPHVALQSEVLTTESKPRTTNFVNMTFDLNQSGPTHAAYLLHGPNTVVTSFAFASSGWDDVTELKINANEKKYRVRFASLILNLAARMKLFGFGAYATVSVNKDKPIVFGAPERPDWKYDRCGKPEDVVRGLVSTYEVKVQQPSSVFYMMFGLLSISAVVFYSARRGNLCKFKCSAPGKFPVLPPVRQRKFITAIFLLITVAFYSSFRSRISAGLRSVCDIPYSVDSVYPSLPPIVYIISLPGSGGEFIGSMFENSTDFLFFSTEDVAPPVKDEDAGRIDPCFWASSEQELHPTTAGWFNSLGKEPTLFLNNLPESNPRVRHLQTKYRKLGKAPSFAVNLYGGFWNSKITWLHGLLPTRHRFVIIVRDPRDWIYSLVRQDLDSNQKEKQREVLTRILETETAQCKDGGSISREYKLLQSLPKSNDVTERLARIWCADVTMTLRTSRSGQVVRFEDLITSPERVARDVMQRLGTTISVPQINRLIRTLHSGHFQHGFLPKLNANSINEWKFDKKTLRGINRVCEDAMNLLGYNT